MRKDSLNCPTSPPCSPGTTGGPDGPPAILTVTVTDVVSLANNHVRVGF